MPATLNLAAVGRVLGPYRTDGKAPEALAVKTVSIYYNRLSVSGGRYEGHPFPAPAGRAHGSPYWLADQVPAIVEWYQTRVGQGQGGGRPWTEEEKARNKAQKLHDVYQAMTPVERAEFEKIAAGSASAKRAKTAKAAKATPPPARGGRSRKTG